MSTLPKVGIPLRPDKAALAFETRRSTLRMVASIALGKIKGQSAESVCSENWNDAPAAVMTRAAVLPMDTNSGLPMMQAVSIVPSIAAPSAAVKLFKDAGVKLDFAGVGTYSIPHLASMPEPTWVGEGGRIPVIQASLDKTIVGPVRKLAFIIPISGELNDYSVEAATAVIGKLMTETSQLALDRAVFSNVAGDALRPPGLLNGVAGITPVAGGGLNALLGDLKNLVGAIAAAKIDTEGAVIVTHPTNALTLETLPPQMLPFAVYTTIAVTPGTVIMIAPEAVATGYEGAATVFISKNAAPHFEDTNPLPIVAAGTPPVVAAPVLSAFQSDLWLLKLIVRAAWGVRSGGAQYLTGCTW